VQESIVQRSFSTIYTELDPKTSINQPYGLRFSVQQSSFFRGRMGNMITAAKSSKRQPRTKKADQPTVTTFAFPTMAEEHLDIPTLETWLGRPFADLDQSSNVAFP
jgi:hypothetical protein